MPFSPDHVKPRLVFIPQRFNPLVLRLMQMALPLVLRVRLKPWLPVGISSVKVVHVERLVRLYQQFQQGKIRFLIAFRHPEVDDPLSMLHLLSRGVAQAAREAGIPLRRPIHSHFIYDRGMTIWAGDWLGWLFSRLGGIPIHRGKHLDRTGLRAARELLVNGQFPVAIAPEGATNGHSGTISPLEPGVARLAFWGLEDLTKAHRPEQVWIVPIGIQYSYPVPPWPRIEQLLGQLEADMGLTPDPSALTVASPEQRCYPRILRLADALLSQLEGFYQRIYHRTLEDGDRPSIQAAETPEARVINRLHRLMDTALRVAEEFFGLASQGTAIERCRRLEEAGWTLIYRDDIPDLAAISPVARGLADWAAQDASLRVRHMRLVESFVAVTESYLQDHPTAERFAEISLLMFDLVARLKGEKMPRRPRLGWRQVNLTVGIPLSVSDRQAIYERDRASAKQVVHDLTQDLQRELENLMHPANPESHFH